MKSWFQAFAYKCNLYRYAVASLVARVARECGADAVVDIGSGKGTLAHVLAFRHGVRVAAVDTQVGLGTTFHNVIFAVQAPTDDIQYDGPCNQSDTWE